jgi:protein TonB
MASLVFANTAAPAAERRTFTVAAVAALHVGVIYLIMGALNIVPMPTVTKPFDFFVVPTVKPPPPTTPHTVSGMVFSHPTDDDTPPPIIDVYRTPTGDGGIHVVPGGVGAQTDMLVAASGLVATHTIPGYPTLDRRLNHEGTVVLALSIGADGSVNDAKIATSSGYDGLDQAAIAWVKAHWRYKPATKGGVAIPSSLNAAVRFKLTQG